MSGSSVVVAAHTYVRRALELLRERCPAADDRPLEMGAQRWVQDDQFGLHGRYRHFVLQPDIWPREKVCAARELAEMRTSPEYQALVAALQADAVIGPRIGPEMVGGAGLGGGPWQVEGQSDNLMFEIIDRAGFAPDDELIRRAIGQWLAHLRREDQVVATFAPLAEFEATGPPIELDDEVTLAELSTDEISAMLFLGRWTVGSMGGDFVGHSGFPRSTTIGPVWALRTKHAFPIVIDGGTPEQAQATQDGHAEDQRLIESALVALRLFKQARVGLYGIVKLTEDAHGGLWPMMGSQLIGALRYRLNPYLLADAETEDLQQFYRDFSAATRSNALVDAVARRFASASDRFRIDDEIVDLVIAAESIFANEPGVTSEVTFRVSNRAALFSDGTTEQRRQLLTFMRKAYGARSQIVHTGKLKEKDLRSLSGGKPSAPEFANELEEVMRVALKKAIGMAASGEPFPPDWDELLLA